MALILPLVFFAIIYFFMIRPQRESARRHDELVAGLEVGDDVLTSSGIYGRIVAADEDSDDIEVEIAPGTVVLMSRRAVAEVAVEVDEDDDEDDDEVDAEDHDVDVDGR